MSAASADLPRTRCTSHQSGTSSSTASTAERPMGSHLFCELRCRLDKNVSSGIGVSVFVQTLCTCNRRESAAGSPGSEASSEESRARHRWWIRRGRPFASCAKPLTARPATLARWGGWARQKCVARRMSTTKDHASRPMRITAEIRGTGSAPKQRGALTSGWAGCRRVRLLLDFRAGCALVLKTP